jgi:putative ATPase
MHYSLIYALHKSIRGSDSNTSLYWLSRILNGCEDRLFIIRRLIRIASEDIGLADPNNLQIVINAKHPLEAPGYPEGELSIFHATIYLCVAPKSNAIFKAFENGSLKASQLNHLMLQKAYS